MIALVISSLNVHTLAYVGLKHTHTHRDKYPLSLLVMASEPADNSISSMESLSGEIEGVG